MSIAISDIDKKIINGKSDVNQLAPIKHGFAYDMYKATNKNFWLPDEVPMHEDLQLWQSNKLSEDERRIIKMNLGFFVTADSLAANNIVLGTYRHITSPECRLFLLQQGYFEAIHTESYHYIVQSLGLNEDEIFNMYLNIKSIKEKDEFLIGYIDPLINPTFQTGSFKNDQKFVKALFAFAVIMEGLFFYVGFVQMLNFGRQQKMLGSSKQFEFIMRDETIHFQFGIKMLQQTMLEQPDLWTPEFKEELETMIERAVQLEYAYAEESMPRGVLGLNKENFLDYLKYIANRRCESLQLRILYPGARNPFPWMSTMIDMSVNQNFFEGTVTEYQKGGLEF